MKPTETPVIRRIPNSTAGFSRNDGPALGCILMASGEGRRFGGNKLLAPFRGRPLLAHILSATETDLFSRRVVVTRHEEVAEICREAGIEAILHHQPHRNDTIRIGLERFGAEPTAGCMFCPCDQPLLSKGTVEALARTFLEYPDGICRLSWQKTLGSPIIFPKAYFAALMALPQGKGGSYVIQSSGAEVRCVEAASEWELKDVDTEEDLKLLESECTAP